MTRRRARLTRLVHLYPRPGPTASRPGSRSWSRTRPRPRPTLYVPWRAGVQVSAGLDPDATRDAWGGPTWLGAALAHWLDGLLAFAAASVVLGWAPRRRCPPG